MTVGGCSQHYNSNTMDDVTHENEVTTNTPDPSTTTEKFNLVKKYLHDWPPAIGVDVSDASTYGIAFIVVIGLLLTCCVIIDIDFFRRKLILVRNRKRAKELERQLRAIKTRGQRRAVLERFRYDVMSYSGRRSPKIVPYHAHDSPPPRYTKVNRSALWDGPARV